MNVLGESRSSLKLGYRRTFAIRDINYLKKRNNDSDYDGKLLKKGILRTAPRDAICGGLARLQGYTEGILREQSYCVD